MLTVGIIRKLIVEVVILITVSILPCFINTRAEAATMQATLPMTMACRVQVSVTPTLCSIPLITALSMRFHQIVAVLNRKNASADKNAPYASMIPVHLAWKYVIVAMGRPEIVLTSLWRFMTKCASQTISSPIYKHSATESVHSANG